MIWHMIFPFDSPVVLLLFQMWTQIPWLVTSDTLVFLVDTVAIVENSNTPVHRYAKRWRHLYTESMSESLLLQDFGGFSVTSRGKLLDMTENKCFPQSGIINLWLFFQNFSSLLQSFKNFFNPSNFTNFFSRYLV